MDKINIDFGTSPIDIFKNKLKELREALTKIQNEIITTEQVIKLLEGGSIDHSKTRDITVNFNGLPDPDTLTGVQLRDYVVELLKKECKPLRSRDAASLLFNIKDEKELSRIAIKVSNSLSFTVKSKVPYVKVHVVHSPMVYWYGLPEWFDDNGHLKTSYISKIEKAA